jgi:hypothetical protein
MSPQLLPSRYPVGALTQEMPMYQRSAHITKLQDGVFPTAKVSGLRTPRG